MPTRDSTAADMLDGFNLLGIVNAKLADVRKVDSDAKAKNMTAESAYQISVKEADSIRDLAVKAAQSKRDKAIKAQDVHVEKARDIAKDARQALSDFQDNLFAETGVRVPLPGDSAAAPKAMSV